MFLPPGGMDCVFLPPGGMDWVFLPLRGVDCVFYHQEVWTVCSTTRRYGLCVLPPGGMDWVFLPLGGMDWVFVPLRGEYQSSWALLLWQTLDWMMHVWCVSVGLSELPSPTSLSVSSSGPRIIVVEAGNFGG